MNNRYVHRPYDADDDDFPARLPSQPRKRPTPKRPPVNATQQRRDVLQQMEDRARLSDMEAERRKREADLGGRDSLRFNVAETERLLRLAETAAEPVRSLLEATANDHMNKVRELRGQPSVKTQRRGMEFADRFHRWQR